MLRAGYLVSLALALPLLVANGCGSSDKTKRAMNPSDGGAASQGGETGDSGSAGSSTEPSGTSGAGGESPDPTVGGNGGTSNGGGGTPSATGGSDGSGDGGSGNSDLFVNACAYPGGGDCDEITGTFDESGAFELECLNNERIPLEACPRDNVAGFCTSNFGGPTVINFHYAPIDPDELAEREEHCLELPGEWAVP